MSLVIALIPVALAVASSVAARKQAEEAGHTALAIQTRMRDDELVIQALEAMGCEAELQPSGVRATRQQFEFAFSRAQDGVLEATFGPDVAPDEAEAFVRDLDRAYTSLVQEKVYRRVIERADDFGMAVESEEVEEDGSILLTLRAGERAPS